MWVENIYCSLFSQEKYWVFPSLVPCSWFVAVFPDACTSSSILQRMMTFANPQNSPSFKPYHSKQKRTMRFEIESSFNSWFHFLLSALSTVVLCSLFNASQIKRISSKCYDFTVSFGRLNWQWLEMRPAASLWFLCSSMRAFLRFTICIYGGKFKYNYSHWKWWHTYIYQYISNKFPNHLDRARPTDI